MSLAAPPARADLDRLALFLDFDGTLVDLAPAPDAIIVRSGLGRALGALATELDGRLAVVSGRYLADVAQYLDGEGFFRSGSHGAELQMPDGALHQPEVALSPSLIAAVDAFAARANGLRIERKPFGLGLHYREAPELAGEVESFVTNLERDHGVATKRGKCVVELLAAPANKGEAVKKLLAHKVFAGCNPIFIGDDVTDEDGFVAVAKSGGFGILVGEERETAARYRLADVARVHAWLGL